MKIESKIAGGQTYIAVKDVAASLRERADDFDMRAELLGDELVNDDFRKAVVYRAVALELRARADWFDVAAVACLSD